MKEQKKKVCSAIFPEYEGHALIFADFPPNQADEKEIIKYFEAGFTHVLMTQDAGIKIKNSDGTLNKAYQDAIEMCLKHGGVMVRNYEKHEKYLGSITSEFADMGIRHFYYADEPTYQEMDKLNELVEWHNTYNKGAMFHVNLLPSYADHAGEHGASTHRKYLEAYVEKILKKVDGERTISIDYYPLEYKHILTMTYLSDLLTVAQVAKEFNETCFENPAKVNFCIQSYQSRDRRGIERVEDLRFQLNMTIAFGAQCFEYYEWSGRPGREKGIVTMEGAYEHVKTVNREVLAWDHIFTSFQWQAAKMYGGYSTNLYRYAKTQFAKRFAKATVKATRATVVSEFKDNNGNYAYMAVNATEPSKGIVSEVALKFVGAKQVITYTNGVEKIYDYNEDGLTLQLASGDGTFCIPIY